MSLAMVADDATVPAFFAAVASARRELWERWMGFSTTAIAEEAGGGESACAPSCFIVGSGCGRYPQVHVGMKDTTTFCCVK